MPKLLPPYLNVTGPGEYDTPSYTGTIPIEAQRRKSPYYTFKRRTKLSAFKEHSLEFLGKDSPGFNKYNAESC